MTPSSRSSASETERVADHVHVAFGARLPKQPFGDMLLKRCRVAWGDLTVLSRHMPIDRLVAGVGGVFRLAFGALVGCSLVPEEFQSAAAVLMDGNDHEQTA